MIVTWMLQSKLDVESIDTKLTLLEQELRAR
jgi:hypothetical protein